MTNAVAGLFGAPCQTRTHSARQTTGSFSLCLLFYVMPTRSLHRGESLTPPGTAVKADATTHLGLGLLIPLLALTRPASLLLCGLCVLARAHCWVRVHVWVGIPKAGKSRRAPAATLHARVRRVRVVRGWLPHPVTPPFSQPSFLPRPPPYKL
jgi:hypothetical protein